MPVQAQIRYYLSEEGRRDSLRNGGDGCRIQTIAGTVANGDLDGFSVSDSGQVSFDMTIDFAPWKFDLPTGAVWSKSDDNQERLEWYVVPTWDALVTVTKSLARAWEDVARQHDEYEEALKETVRKFLADGALRADRLERDYVRVGKYSFYNDDPTAIEARKRWAADQEELKKQNRATIGEWILRNGTDNQRDRLNAGLLPWAEAYSSAEEYFYRPLADVPLYERFDAGQVCRCNREWDEQPCKIKFRSADAIELTAEEWNQFANIKALVPGASFQLRQHHAQCRSGHEEMKRGVIVKFVLGQLSFKRQYALTGVQSAEVPF